MTKSIYNLLLLVTVLTGLPASSLLAQLLDPQILGDNQFGSVNLQSTLVLARDGNLYGTTYSINGGTNGYLGTVFRATTNGIVTNLVVFTGANGADPLADLLLGDDGRLYGTTYHGGTDDHGTVFAVTTNGVLTTLAYFTPNSGLNPQGKLVQGPDGFLYGTTFYGGSDDFGTIFKVNTSGTAAGMVVDFTADNGIYPAAGLTLGNDGNFYGTTTRGGANDKGIVFQVTPDGVFSNLVSFARLDGESPTASLTLGRDGALYGTTASGGSRGYGTIFRVTTNGQLSVVVNFTSPNEASLSGLTLGTNGIFYGTTYGVNTNSYGTVFSVTPGGTFTTLVNFANTNGANPSAGLTMGRDSHWFYGITSSGGALEDGVLYALQLPVQITTQPVDQSVTNIIDPIGPTVSFTVGAIGTGPFSYQWLFNSHALLDGAPNVGGSFISGARTATLTISNVTERNAGKYSCTVSNAGGTATSIQAQLRVNGVRVPDTTGPVLRIKSPVGQSTRVTSNLVNIVGTAIDIEVIDSVLVRIGTNDYVPAIGTTNWTTTVELKPGANIVSIKATDHAGNSTTASRSLTYVVTSPITLGIAGTGTVKGATNGQFLEVGKQYALTALPGAGFVFSNWTGDASSPSNVLNFIMQSNLMTTANFVPNPFLPGAGIYNGLFYETGGVRHGASGFFTATVTTDGKYTGRLQNGTKQFPFLGKFNLEGNATNIVKRSGTNSVALELSLDLHGADAITGRVTNDSWVARLDADRAVFNARHNPATNFARAYTLLIPGSTNTDIEPAGDGPGAVVVDAGGGVRYTGLLADSSPAAQKTTLSKAGAWPLYVSLYGGRGSLLGWLLLTNSVDPDLGGVVSWTKPAARSPKIYTNGFVVTPMAIGSVYRAPGTNKVFNLDSAIVSFNDGNLDPGFTNIVGLIARDKVTNASPNKLTLTLVPSSGQFSGSATLPGSKKSIPFKGAVLQKQGYGGGFFLGTNESGRVYFGP